MRKPDIYRPLLDRTVENYQVQHLVRKFDFGKESRIARLIVHAINAAVEQEEANLRITRVRPFELYLQMYTATEIVARAGHSYETVER